MNRFKYHLPGTPPATLVAPTTEKPVVTLTEYDAENYEERHIDHIEECFPFRDNGQVTWINISGLGDVELLKKLGAHYHLHPLALEDVLNVGQRPKIEHYDHHYFIVLQMVYCNAEQELVFEQVSIFLGKDYVITVRESGGKMFDPVRQRLQRASGFIRTSGADYLCYTLMDAVVDHYFPILESFGDLIEELEDEVLGSPDQSTVAKLHDYKRNLVHLRRGAWPQREVLSALGRDEIGIVHDATKPFLRDCYDHSIQVIDIIENYRELTSSIMDVYLSAVSQRTNEIMRVLTVLSSIFMPLTFFVGIYGMNFDVLPELHWRYGYLFFWIVTLIISGSMAFYFKHKKWL